MATTVIMPQMGYDMREGTVVRWHKNEGDDVARGDILAEIETDKATVEMEAFSPGILGKIVVEEGRTVPVGDLIAVIVSPGEAVPELEQLGGTPSSPILSSEAAPPPLAPPDSSDVKASPLARRLAREKGIPLGSITGTGPGGRITEADVNRAEAAAPLTSAQGSSEGTENSPMRRAIARITAQSKREVPHFYVTAEVNMSQAMSVRRQVNETLPEGQRVSVNDLIVKASALALVKHPRFNASLDGDRLMMHDDLNIGIAVALEQGLIVPCISRCQDRSLVEIANASSDLIRRTQDNRLRAEEYSGSTFSISNLGMHDVDSFAAIILPPNASVMAVGAVREQPVVQDGQIVVGQVMKATLSVDHRIADGAEGAAFLVEIKANLENPVRLLL